MAKKEKANGTTQAEQANAEPPHDGSGVASMAPTSEPNEIPPDAQGPPAEPATEAPQDDPGPEDFERHAGARLLADQGADLRLQEEIEKRLRKRGDIIAKRLRASGGVNSTVEINGVAYVARQRPKCPGEMMLSEAVTHTRATLA